ncbi:DUF2750 domain-containing protein [Alteromonas facilis]|uniref:DUF2750 domain-containing protein n=1 Tax=Alteromonas facilis TaxID=2048004 RepID=UPI000C28EAD7|nr:DUF2750 domain-containing protein [Alteromonas facilis]
MQIDGHDAAADKLSSEEFLRVTRLTPEQRFDYFLEHLKTIPVIWGLFGKNGWVMVESENELCLPIWPHHDFVVGWERDDFPECEPKSIELEEFLSVWAEGLAKNNTLLLLFPCGEEEEGIVISANEWVECVNEALSNAS